ncbi:hypothetical protein DFH29DRAFT_878603 [Suillus ampliporus]|nr:hypothetical protein DFH29DRAFT_878603 [Suillus ampliporus]
MTYYAGHSTVDVPKAHSFYSLDGNFWKFTLDNLTMASMLSISQRYYVPRRIHEMHRPCSIGKQPKKDNPKNEYMRAFEQDKVLLEVFSQARAPFATLCAKLLDEQKIFSRERMTDLMEKYLIYRQYKYLVRLDGPLKLEDR